MLEINMELLVTLRFVHVQQCLNQKGKKKSTIMLVSTWHSEYDTFHWETETFKIETCAIVESGIGDWCGY